MKQIIFTIHIACTWFLISWGQSTIVYTPKGSSVTAEIHQEYTPAYITYLNNLWSNNYPEAQFISNSSNLYNCHSYALNNGQYWINNPEDDIYFNDGSYIEVCNLSEAQVVSYISCDHTAINVGGGYLQSKWNDGPVMRHLPTDRPFISNGWRYYVHYDFYNPIINGNSSICNSTSYILTQAPCGYITWSKSSNLSIVSGQGTGSCTFSTSGSGTGWVEASFSGMILHKDVFVGSPNSSDFPITITDDCFNVQYGITGYFYFCPNSYYELILPEPDYITGYNWSLPTGWQVISNSGRSVVVLTPSALSYTQFYISLQTACGWHNNILVFNAMPTTECGCGWLMSISPNPATNETIIELTRKDKKEKAETLEWELEVYDQSHAQKVQALKLKDKKYKLNIQGWREGIYIVRVKVEDEIVAGKLVVKK